MLSVPSSAAAAWLRTSVQVHLVCQINFLVLLEHCCSKNGLSLALRLQPLMAVSVKISHVLHYSSKCALGAGGFYFDLCQLQFLSISTSEISFQKTLTSDTQKAGRE